MEGVKESPFQWLFENPTGQPTNLEWTAKLDHRQQPRVLAANDGYEQPYLGETHGMLFTAAVIPTPELEHADVHLSFTAPPEWSIVTPWPKVQRAEQGGADGAAQPCTFQPSLDAPRDDIVLLGNWHVHETTTAGLTATFAFTPGEEWLEP